jgi:hypothetical protein
MDDAERAAAMQRVAEDAGPHGAAPRGRPSRRRRTARQHDLACSRRPAKTAAARIGDGLAQPRATCDAGQEATRPARPRRPSQDPGVSRRPGTGRRSSHLDTAVTDSEHPRPHGQQYRA